MIISLDEMQLQVKLKKKKNCMELYKAPYGVIRLKKKTCMF